MRKSRLVFVGLGLAAVIGASVPSFAGSATPAAGSVRKVRADGFQFCSWSKSSCTSTDAGHVTKVAVGTKVKWIYADDECDANALCPGHNVHLGSHTSADVKQDGALIKAMTFNSVGKFHYWCTHHSTDTNHTTGMYGYIKVHS